MTWLLALVLGLSWTACTTAPPKLKTSAASWDGSEQNSGEIAFHTNAAGVFLEVSPHWRDRYNSMATNPALVSRLAVPVKPDEGLTLFTNGNWLVDLQHLDAFTDMNRWRRERSPP